MFSHGWSDRDIVQKNQNLWKKVTPTKTGQLSVAQSHCCPGHGDSDAWSFKKNNCKYLQAVSRVRLSKHRCEWQMDDEWTNPVNGLSDLKLHSLSLEKALFQCLNPGEMLWILFYLYYILTNKRNIFQSSTIVISAVCQVFCHWQVSCFLQINSLFWQSEHCVYVYDLTPWSDATLFTLIDSLFPLQSCWEYQRTP